MLRLSPPAVMAALIAILTFESLLFGVEIAERTAPVFAEPDSGGFWSFLDPIISLIQGIFTMVVFMFNLITFNVPGADAWARFLVGGIQVSALGYGIAGLIRGFASNG